MYRNVSAVLATMTQSVKTNPDHAVLLLLASGYGETVEKDTRVIVLGEADFPDLPELTLEERKKVIVMRKGLIRVKIADGPLIGNTGIVHREAIGNLLLPP